MIRFVKSVVSVEDSQYLKTVLRLLKGKINLLSYAFGFGGGGGGGFWKIGRLLPCLVDPLFGLLGGGVGGVGFCGVDIIY
jgi:hypothetical protein